MVVKFGFYSNCGNQVKVGIINYDHLSVDIDLEVLPRVGETFSCKLKDGHSFTGIVREVQHNYNEIERCQRVVVFLKPE